MQIETNDDILKLIKCLKYFKQSPKKCLEKNRNYDQRFDVYGKNGEKFNIFITQSMRMLQDFSIGLMYENMFLLRCNGFHGTTSTGFYNYPHHQYPHLHILQIDDIENARERKPSLIKDVTGKFVDLNTAIVFFCNECGIIEYEKYFESFTQLTL